MLNIGSVLVRLAWMEFLRGPEDAPRDKMQLQLIERNVGIRRC